jgi:para-nitrobenzyl esterase
MKEGRMSAVVSTSLGQLAGEQQSGLYVFRGVPYARPPVGPLRFRAPQPPVPWTGVRSALTPGPTAPQVLGLMRDLAAQDEDCLQLNVWTPRLSGRRPVLVFIHGGGFTGGASTHPMYDGGALARRGDVVVVSFNYRLGALGFADLGALGDERFGADSNVGLRDQLAALHWVQAHIADFGGDPGQVTVFGQSAGAMSVAALLTSPAGKGLFNRAIAQSGAGHHALARSQAAGVAERLLDALGIGPHELARLRELPAEAIAQAQPAAVTTRTTIGLPDKPLYNGAMGLLPVIDGDVVPELPVLAAARGAGADVPLLLGSTRDEQRFWIFLSDPRKRELDETGLLRVLDARVPGRARDVCDAYRALLGDGRQPWHAFSAIETDRVFALPAQRLCEARVRAPGDGSAGTYLYHFDWRGPLFEGELGACHTMDVPFVLGGVDEGFGRVFSGGGAAARALSDRVMDAWLAFARTGDPSCERIGAWPRFSAARDATCMQLAQRCELTAAPHVALNELWSGLV